MPVLAAIVLTINEERFIRQCLEPLAAVLPFVIVADTGSTDNNLAEIAKVSNIHQMHSGRLTMEQLGKRRGEMAQFAKGLGATHVMQVDGDEIYPTSYLRYIVENPMPDVYVAGYTTGVECAELPNGEIWKYDTDFNRCAVFSVDCKFRGAWPYEAPDAWRPNEPATQYHFPRLEPYHNFYHMHHLVRSSRDADVTGRLEYKNLFALQQKPELTPAQFLFPTWAEYKDV
jgi:glycosyltransferase involved in cell wall biosynthesis